MVISVRQLFGAVVVSFCLGSFITPVWTQAQGGAQSAPASSAAAKTPTFMQVEFMKVPEGKEQDWLKLEREWKPVHELRVRDGSIQSWAAIAQAMPGDESDGPIYATVTTYRKWPDPTKTNYTELFQKAHPQVDMNAMWERTASARRLVRSEIWQVLDQTEPKTMGTN